MYDRTFRKEVLVFSNTHALYQSDMVMVDHQTGSYWMQVTGEAIVGALTGSRLTALPSQMTTWGYWKGQYPDTLALSRETGYARNYEYDPFIRLGEQLSATGQFTFPVSNKGRDARLAAGEIVLGVEVAGHAALRAYPIQRIGDGVINDLVGQTPVAVFCASAGPTGAAYLAKVNEATLLFDFVQGAFRDRQTASEWNLAGLAIGGSFAGVRLRSLPARSTFWFSLVASFPEIDMYHES